MCPSSDGARAAARARLFLSLEHGSPAVRRVVEKVEAAGGEAWALTTLRGALGESRRLVARPSPERRELRAEARALDEDERTLVTSALDAAAVLAGERESPPDPDDLLELAAVVSGDWSDLLADAAQALRAELDAPEPGDEGPAPGERIHGERIQGYRLLEPIGRGAYGSVYRAQHLETGRLVALKLLRPDAYSPASEARFRTEARVLSGLSHPGIATLFDAGFHESLGVRLPFIAMELVHGVPVHEYAEARALPLDERLRIFVQVCAAIDHAHQHDVVHRDLHPGNVLVTRDGSPKVVDFGAALSTASEGECTRSGFVIGTLAYMSPEQAAGSPSRVDQRTDVHALGALLFTLISGETPHDLHGLSLPDALRHVTEVEPRRLREVVPEVPRDVDAIVSQALAHEPERRYPTVRALGEDVRRCLMGLPVEARPPSLPYVLGKLLRRHRLAFALAAAAVLLLAGTTVWALRGWSRVRAKDRELAASYASTRRIAEGVIQVADGLSERAGGDPVPILQQFSGIEQDLIGDGPVDAWGQGMLLRLRSLRGDIAMRANDLDQAEAIRAAAVDLALRRQALRPDDPNVRADLSIAQVKLGDVYRARQVEAERAGRTGDAERFREQRDERYDRALEIDRELTRDSTDTHFWDDLVWSYSRKGALALDEGRTDEALGLLQQAVDTSEQLLAHDPDRVLSHFAHGTALKLLADWYRLSPEPDLDEAAELARRAVPEADRALAAKPQRRAFLELAFSVNSTLGYVEQARGDPGAAPAFERAVAILGRLVDDEPDRASYHITYIGDLRKLAHLRRAAGDLAGASACYAAAYEGLLKASSLGVDFPEPPSKLAIWMALLCMGVEHERQHEDAVRHWHELARHRIEEAAFPSGPDPIYEAAVRIEGPREMHDPSAGVRMLQEYLERSGNREPEVLGLLARGLEAR